MKCLIVEDDFISRCVLKNLLQSCLGRGWDYDIAIDGGEAVESFRLAQEARAPYDLICLDIMMPGMDGSEALLRIRKLEKELAVLPSREVKVIMTTALDDPHSVIRAFYEGGATSYLVKPIGKQKLMKELSALGLT